MRAFKVKYHHGHFIDEATNERIVPIQGCEYIITADPTAFAKEDSKLKNNDALSSEEKREWAFGEFGEQNCKRISSSGDKFFFRVGNSRMIEGDENPEYIFTCILQEDLYLFKIDGRDGRSEEDWRLAPCLCSLEDCVAGGLTLTEKITATSLTKLFRHTVMFYFNMQHSGSCNAFDTFFVFNNDININFSGIRTRSYNRLRNLRKSNVETVPNKSN